MNINVAGISSTAWSIQGDTTVLARVPEGYCPKTFVYISGRFSTKTQISSSIDWMFHTIIIKNNGDVTMQSTSKYSNYKYLTIYGTYGI